MKILIILCIFLNPCTLFANNLTPERAISILDEASAQAVLNRQGHVLIIKSINVLRNALKEKSVETQPVGVPE